MSRPRLFLAAVAAFCSVLSVDPTPAQACGGCFGPPTESAPVTGHRMAFSINSTRTVLWDQFEYAGSPTDFSWVLPIRPGAYLEAATDAWFFSLDSGTTVSITAPQLNCAGTGSGSGSSFGCAGGDDSTSAFGGTVGGDPGVTVVSKQTVGPYEVVTLRSTDPDALGLWLTGNGYAVPAATEPLIDAYVDEGWDFLALRLAPDQGVQQMTPVRVVTPDGDNVLPLRMVAAGAADDVDITLFVLAEERYGMPDLRPVAVRTLDLTWDFAISSSNYTELRREALWGGDRRNVLTPYSRKVPFGEARVGPTGFPIVYATPDFRSLGTLAELYFARAATDDGATITPNCQSVLDPLSATQLVVEGSAGAGQISSKIFLCEKDEHSDLAAAMVGMHPANLWLTRLEMRLPRAALDADCAVTPAVGGEVDNLLLARRSKNAPCPQAVFSNVSSGGTDSSWFLFGLAALAMGWRRRRARGQG